VARLPQRKVCSQVLIRSVFDSALKSDKDFHTVVFPIPRTKENTASETASARMKEKALVLHIRRLDTLGLMLCH
jgi:hypothetical protein